MYPGFDLRKIPQTEPLKELKELSKSLVERFIDRVKEEFNDLKLPENGVMMWKTTAHACGGRRILPLYVWSAFVKGEDYSASIEGRGLTVKTSVWYEWFVAWCVREGKTTVRSMKWFDSGMSKFSTETRQYISGTQCRVRSLVC